MKIKVIVLVGIPIAFFIYWGVLNASGLLDVTAAIYCTVILATLINVVAALYLQKRGLSLLFVPLAALLCLIPILIVSAMGGGDFSGLIIALALFCLVPTLLLTIVACAVIYAVGKARKK